MKVKRFCAALLALFMLAPLLNTAVLAAETVYDTELSAAVAFADLMEKGETSMSLTLSSSRFDFTLCYRYLSMLYRDAYVFEYIPSPRNALIRVNYNDADKHAAAELKAAELVSSLINDSMGDYEKYYALYSWLRDNCLYDMHAALNQSTETGDAFSAYGALVDGKAVCDGLSSAFAMLCRHAGLPCIYISSTEMNHSWNAVLYSGRLMYLDVTYDITNGSEVNYFMLDEDSLSVDHTWDKAMVRALTDEVWDEGFVSAYTLNRLGGLFRGSDKGWELDRVPNRAEAAIMLVRFLGLESYALENYSPEPPAPEIPELPDGSEYELPEDERPEPEIPEDRLGPAPFDDVNPNHAAYIALLYKMGLTNGTGETTFSPDDEVSLKDYMTFMLRALKYSEADSFSWETAPEDALGLGVLSQQQYDHLIGRVFDRGEMAYAAMAALTANDADGRPLYESLIESGAINEKMAKDFLANS